MMRMLLVRGLLAGLVAGVFAFVFARLFGEGSVDAAIAFEEAGAAGHDHGAGAAAADDAELVSRATQAGPGLVVGMVVYALAFGGLFAVAFAVIHGRLGGASARATALGLAVTGYLVTFVVPFLKYPATPPAVGDPGTIGVRTQAFFGLVLLSILVAVAAAVLARRLTPRLGGFGAATLAVGAYVVVIAVIAAVLPGGAAVPDAFPAGVLWDFRLASLGIQLIMWMTLGVLFGALVHRRGAARTPVAA